MFEQFIESLKLPFISDAVKNIADAITQPVQTQDTPLSSETSEYVNDLAKETYGDEAAPIQTELELAEANRRAAINAAQEDFDASVDRDTQAVIDGTLTPYDMQRNALLRSQAMLRAEMNGDFGLAVENTRQLSMDAMESNKSILTEDPSVTAELERINTNRAMLQQAAMELVKSGGITGNVYAVGRNLVPIVSAKGTYSRLPEELRGKFFIGTAENTLTYADMWNKLINTLSNQDMQDAIKVYTKWLKEEQGYTDAMAGHAILTAFDPSPVAEAYGLAGDAVGALSALSKGITAAVTTGAKATLAAEQVNKLSSKYASLSSKLLKAIKEDEAAEKIAKLNAKKSEVLKLLMEADDAVAEGKALTGLPNVIDHTLGAVGVTIKEAIELYPILGPATMKLTRAASSKLGKFLKGIGTKKAQVFVDAIKQDTKGLDKITSDKVIEVADSLNLHDELVKSGVVTEEQFSSATKMPSEVQGATVTEVTYKVQDVSDWIGYDRWLNRQKGVTTFDKLIADKSPRASSSKDSWLYNRLLKSKKEEQGVKDVIEDIKETLIAHKAPSEIAAYILNNQESVAKQIISGGYDAEYLRYAKSEKVYKDALYGWLLRHGVGNDAIVRDFDRGPLKGWVETKGTTRQIGVDTKPVQSLEDYVKIDDSADMSTAVGRRKAVRDEEGAAKVVVELVEEGDKDNPNVVRTITHEYVDGAANVTVKSKSLANIDTIKAERDYQLVLNRAQAQLASTGKLGITGLRAEMLEQAAVELMDSLDASNTLYRTTGISNVMRTQLGDVIQESDKGDLFALVRSNKFYKTREGAEEAARKLSSGGIVETSVMPTRSVPKGAQNAVDGWAVDAKINLNRGFGSLAYETLGDGDKKYKSFFSSLKTATSNPLHVRRLNALRENEAAHLLEYGVNAEKAYKSTHGSDRQLLNMLLDHSLETESWFKPEYLKAKGVPQKVTDAYNSYRLLNDVDWIVMNAARREEMIAKGLRKLSFGGKGLGYGKIRRDIGIEQLESTQRLIIYGDVDAVPTKFKDLNIDREAFKQNYLDKGWVVVERAYGPDEFTDAGSVYYVLPGHSLTESDIPAVVTNYVAGGRRFFSRDAGYVKQLKFTKNSMGRDVITGVNTFATDLDVAGLENKAGKIEAVRQEVVKQRQAGILDDAAITNLMQTLKLEDVPFTDATSFIKWAEGRGIDLVHLNNNLVVVKDGQGFEKFAGIAKGFESALTEEELASTLHRSAYQAMTNEKKMQKWLREGKDLLAYNFKDTAKIADYDKVMSYMVQDMINAGVMNKYTDMIAEDFAKQFSSVIPNSKTMSARQMLYYTMNGNQLVDNSKLSKQALTAAKNYQAIRSIPTDLDAAVADVFNGVFKSLGVDAFEALGVSDEVAHKIRAGFKAVDSKNPQRLLRYNASMWWMGLVNTKQLLSQSAPVIYFTAMDPINTAKTMKYWVPMTFEMLSSHGSYSRALEKFLAKSGEKTEYAQGLWKALMDGRIFENTPLGGAFEPSKARGVWSYVDRINFAPKTFAEVLNRVAAHSVAYEKLGFGSKGIQSAADMARWKSLGNTYYINMDATGLSRIQSSQTGKTLLQFWSANMRFWETMMFDKNLTQGQRIRLAGTTLALSGLGGFVGTEWSRKITNAFNTFDPEEYTQHDFTDEQVSQVRMAVEGGLLAYMSGVDGYDWSSKIALPVTDMVTKFDEISSMDVLKIPAVSAVTQQAGFVKDLWHATQAFNNSTSTYEGWVNSLRVIQQGGNAPSSLKAYTKGALLLMEGKTWNKKGQLKDEDNSTLAAAMAVLGVDKSDYTNLTKAYVDYVTAKDKISAYKDLLRPVYNYWVDTHSDQAWELMVHLRQNSGISKDMVLQAEKELQSEERFSTIETDRTRAILRSLRNPVYGTYMNQIENTERIQN